MRFVCSSADLAKPQFQYVPGEVASFRVNTSKAGRRADASAKKRETRNSLGSSLLFVGVVTCRGPSEEVAVRHVGGGEYNVSYKIPERTRALVLIKYGDREILGSPFTVRPAVASQSR